MCIFMIWARPAGQNGREALCRWGTTTPGWGWNVQPAAAGIAITANGQQIVVANYYNDSISVLTKGSQNTWSKTGELDLRPGKINPSQSGTPGGEYPFWVVIKGNNTAYVSSIRDREIDVITLGADSQPDGTNSVTGQPNKMVLNAAGTTLYVAQDQSDSVAVIDTASNTVRDHIFVGGSPEKFPHWVYGHDASRPPEITPIALPSLPTNSHFT